MLEKVIKNDERATADSEGGIDGGKRLELVIISIVVVCSDVAELICKYGHVAIKHVHVTSILQEIQESITM